MARRQRRSINGRLALVACAGAGVVWLWSQTWGLALVIAVAAALATGAITRITMAARRRRRRLLRLATLQGLLDLTPREFEEEVAELLRSLGFVSVEVCAGAGDLQADIVATDPDGLATIVQCKRYAGGRTVGSPVIQSFIGMARIHHECERALFVTTGSFTKPACGLADEHDIELIDGADLVELFTRRAGLVAAG